MVSEFEHGYMSATLTNSNLSLMLSANPKDSKYHQSPVKRTWWKIMKVKAAEAFWI